MTAPYPVLEHLLRETIKYKGYGHTEGVLTGMFLASREAYWNPDDTTPCAYNAAFHFMAGKRHEAKVILNAFLKLRPHDAEPFPLWQALAEVCNRRGAFKRAFPGARCELSEPLREFCKLTQKPACQKAKPEL